MATHSSSLAWEIPWTEESGGLQTIRSQKNWKTKQLHNSRQPLHIQQPLPVYDNYRKLSSLANLRGTEASSLILDHFLKFDHYIMFYLLMNHNIIKPGLLFLLYFLISKTQSYLFAFPLIFIDSYAFKTVIVM